MAYTNEEQNFQNRLSLVHLNSHSHQGLMVSILDRKILMGETGFEQIDGKQRYIYIMACTVEDRNVWYGL